MVKSPTGSPVRHISDAVFRSVFPAVYPDFVAASFSASQLCGGAIDISNSILEYSRSNRRRQYPVDFLSLHTYLLAQLNEEC